MHLYKMFRPFVNEDIEITNNYVLSRNSITTISSYYSIKLMIDICQT